MARSSKLARGVAVAVVTAVVACGSSASPPFLRDPQGVPDAGVDAPPPSLIGDAGPILRSCGTGPDGGVCACADEPLAIDPPILYFVLDRSGSMSTNGKWATVVSVVEQVALGLGPRIKIGAAVFPDPAVDQCQQGLQVFPVSGGKATAPVQGDGAFGTPGPVLKAFDAALAAISPSGGTPTAATLQALLPQIEGYGGKAYVVLATDGGPNCNDAATCTSATCTLNLEGDNGCKATGPNCCVADGGGSSSDCLDTQPTVDAVTAYAKSSIPVYVVGVPGSEPYATVLDALAIAGGTARGGEPQYYAVSTYDQQALATAMSKIAAKIVGSCTLTLDQVPPVPDQVNVFLDGTAIPQAGADGWTLNGKTVTILGKSCAAILDGSVIDVRVVAGCPTLTH